MKKFNEFITKKLIERSGETNTLSIVGWSFVAVMVVLAISGMLPDQITGFIEKIFTKFSTGLGV